MDLHKIVGFEKLELNEFLNCSSLPISQSSSVERLSITIPNYVTGFDI
jgi:hypothetical protein